MLVSEYMAGGAIRQLLLQLITTGGLNRWLYVLKHSFSPESKLRLALDIAQGLSYLHSVAPQPVVHRDMKSDNVRVAEQFDLPRSFVQVFLDDLGNHAKVGDLGLAKFCAAKKANQLSSPSLAGTLMCGRHFSGRLTLRRYAAPEQLLQHTAGTPLDVYAWALVMYELYSGYRPYPDDWDVDTMRSEVAIRGFRPELDGPERKVPVLL